MHHYSQRDVQDLLEYRAIELHDAAETLPDGNERDSMLRRARRMEDASLVIERWASSPGLRSPK
jgi:hypothetical protein